MSHSPKGKDRHLMNVSEDQNNKKNVKKNMKITINGKQLNEDKGMVLEDSKVQPISSSIRKLQNLSKSPSPATARLSPRSPVATNSPKSFKNSRILSPKSSRLPLIQQLEEMIKNLQKSKQKLKSIIELYEMIDDNQNSRCFQHANILSLYCINQRKILCVNCLYGNDRHRCHKVMPLKDCMERVSEDNAYLATILQKQIQKLTQSSKKAQQNLKYLTQQIRTKQDLLQKQYQQQQKCLQIVFSQKKKTLHNLFSPILQKYQTINKLFLNFKDSLWRIKIMLSGGLKSNGRGKNGKGNQQDVMKHVLGVSVVEIAGDLGNGCRAVGQRDVEAICRGRVVDQDK